MTNNKKTAAQIRRMQQRAASRGDSYGIRETLTLERSDASTVSAAAKANKGDNLRQGQNTGDVPDCALSSKTKISMVERQRIEVDCASKLKESLALIDQDNKLNAKSRRSAKRKATALAIERSGFPASVLLSGSIDVDRDILSRSNGDATGSNKIIKKDARDDSCKAPDIESGNRVIIESQYSKKKIPYILFVGQLAFKTSREGLYQHFERNLGTGVITPSTLSVRLLTDRHNSKKSRGMAFVEASNADLMHECLKLHCTTLDGRRINVERSAGGSKQSAARKEKLSQRRLLQRDHMSQIVDSIIKQYKLSGKLSRDELDQGVISLCKRHSAATVESSLAQYVEARGAKMGNPSAYLTHIIGRVAADDINDEASSRPTKKAEGLNLRPLELRMMTGHK